ncbi:acetoacetate--CoA ligase [Ramlibacter aurantiacus]|uniref:acetoacetate--CoA ligase n=1 Tax=Ramlibacter aurantiacus TaxID=2801330 RepID=UPI003F498528
MPLQEGDVLWRPSPAQLAATRMSQYQTWLAQNTGREFSDYSALWRWSVDELETFWQSIWEFFDVQADGGMEPVLTTRSMPGAQWYPKARLNYAEHVFRQANADRPALICRAEDEPRREISWAELASTTGAMAEFLRRAGVRAGDRVAAYLPNRDEAVIAFLACASIGAVWSSCSPDMGPTVVLDRLRQIEPKLLIVTDSYRYAGKLHDRVEVVEQLLAQLPSVRAVIHVDGPLASTRPVTWNNCIAWNDCLARQCELVFDRVPFSHPLWIVYSSGTTGLPKAMVHGHGGIVLTHLKTLGLQHDLREGERLLFLGSTGWIVWNLQAGALLAGATAVLYDGHPSYPNADALWRVIDQEHVTLFGCGAAYLTNCMKQGLRPGEVVALESLRSINSTGSPLPLDCYAWVYQAVKQDVWLASVSGGTDIASGFVACAPMLPVTAGELQCAELGVAAYAYDEAGQAVLDRVGELVITQPMPSMPLFFWNDPKGARYRESYFGVYPGIWRHGDWIRFTPRGTAVIYGRSDSTINRFGIRMGTAEIYGVVEALPEICDSLVVDLEYLGRPSFLPLFVVLSPDCTLEPGLKARIKEEIRNKASARHVPDEIYEVDEIPRTLTGKKLEVPVRKLLLGVPLDSVASQDSMANPASLAYFVKFAAGLQRSDRESSRQGETQPRKAPELGQS